jgi:hypothetical protein
MSALWEYYCQVPVNGYEVITDDEWGAKIQARSKQTKRFDLFKYNSSAFLDFAQTPATEDGIKDFADRYGPLFPAGDVIKFWSEEIRTMHRTVELWNMSKKTGDFRKLISVVRKTFLKVGLVDEEPGVTVELFLKEDPLSACIRPRTLLHALWAQLVLAIDGNMDLGVCVQCRKWFRLDAGRGRSDKQYCSNACRMRAYRKRKVSG